MINQLILSSVSNMQHAIIVGGGVAGLHVGIHLLKHNKPVCIMDEYHCGGRVQTYRIKDHQWENGAGRISVDHRRTLAYLKKYDLTCIPLPTQIDYLSKNKTIIENPFFALQKPFLELIRSLPPSVLATKTIKEILKEVMPHETDFYNAFPYYAEMATLRADLALESFECEMGTHKGFFVCKEGLSELIDNMKAEFIALGGIIKENVRVESVETVNRYTYLHGKDRITQERFSVPTQLCVLAIPSNALEKLIKIPAVTTVTRHLKIVPLLRIYMVFKKSWFADLKSTVVNGPIRYIIPINETTIMISYTEGPYATHWMNMDPKVVCRSILDEIRHLFPERNIPHPEIFKMHPWSTGCTYWQPGDYDVDEMSYKILNPKKGIFACGESYARKQCWIESALEHASMLLKHPEFVSAIKA